MVYIATLFTGNIFPHLTSHFTQDLAKLYLQNSAIFENKYDAYQWIFATLFEMPKFRELTKSSVGFETLLNDYLNYLKVEYNITEMVLHKSTSLESVMAELSMS
jgi:hypothetical protein